jgi:MFS family permease
MELDELKSLLNQKLTTAHSGRSTDDIAHLLTRKTSSVIDKLKRSLWIEIISCIVIILGFGYIGIAGSYRSLRIYFSVFAILAIVFLFIVIYLLRKTQALSATSLPVKSNLQMIVSIIEAFMKRYFQFTIGLIPVCVIFSFLLGYNEPMSIPEVDKVTSSLFTHLWQMLLFLGLYIVALSIGIYYFTKWYLRKLYGRYVAQLKECIAELEEQQ